MERFDAIVVGGGPTGLTATALLGNRGWKVAAFEKRLQRYSMPRAGHIDHEVMRIVQAVGAHQAIIDDDAETEVYEWFNGEGKTLLSFPMGEASISGFQSDYMMFQPVLDGALHEAIDRIDNADVVMGRAVTGLDQDADGVALTLAHMVADGSGHAVPSGEESTVWAPYVLAADGAGSPVRDAMLGIPREDFGFNEDWLVIDVRLKRDLPDGVSGQWCDPRRPIYIGALGKRYHRFECAVLPGETEEQMLDSDFAWRILAERGVGPDDVEIFRQVVYAFEARVAERWREGRVFLLGDAAHTMPPFMGQGLCSGVRDCANLAWKLDLVRGGLAPDELLDTYEEERRPHVKQWIDLSITVGKISCTFDAEEARQRDDALLSGNAPPLPGFPTLAGGVLSPDAAGELHAPVGEFFVQAPVAGPPGEGLLHDVVGHGFLLVGADGDPRAALGEEELALLEWLGCRVWFLGESVDGGLADPIGAIAGWFEEHGIAAALVRPDYYVAGTVDEYAELPGLVGWLGGALGGAYTEREPA